MALVVLLRGVNVGGHRVFRPAALIRELRHLDAINIGAAGTFIVRKPVTRSELRELLSSKVPAGTAIVVCEGREVVRLMSDRRFAGQTMQPNVVRFVTVLSRRPRLSPSIPMQFPSSGPWLLKILARDGQFVVGKYRRHLKVIGYLGKIDRLFGVPVTTRNWNTMTTIAKVLEET